MDGIVSFFNKIFEGYDRRGEIVEFLFGPFFRFLEAHGISMWWGVLLIGLTMNFAAFLWGTSRIVTGRKLTLRERWKFFWQDVDVPKTVTIIFVPFLLLCTWPFLPIPWEGGWQISTYLLTLLTLWVVHFIFSTNKYVDKRRSFSWKNLKIRWEMYWWGFDSFKGLVIIFVPTVFFLIALGEQFR